VVADDIRAEFSLGASVNRFAAGSVPVFAVDDHFVVKLFPSNERSHFETERAALTLVDNSLSIPTPRVVAAGERGEWWYVVMTRLQGQPLAEVWQSIGTDERCRLLRDVGTTLAELHSIAHRECGPLAIDWARFMQAQKESCRERQAARGLGAPWL